MGFLTEVQEAQETSSRRPCKVRTVLAALPPKDADELRVVLDDPQWQAVVIERVLKQRGISVSDCIIRRHRNGECSCAGG